METMEHCTMCIHNLDQPQYSLLLTTLHEMLIDFELPPNCIADIQERLCANAGCLD